MRFQTLVGIVVQSGILVSIITGFGESTSILPKQYISK